jgi:MraZ protein
VVFLSLFLSTFCNKIDAKGRVSVPASFRAALAGQTFQGIVAFRSLTLAAVEGFGMDRMEKLSLHMDRLDLFSQDQDDWAASIFADAQHLAFDSEGRVTLTEELKVHARLGQNVAFVGRGPTFQLWNPDDFRIYQDEARLRLRERKGLGLGALVAPPSSDKAA